MMAPSLETSVRGHLPVPPTTPVRVMTDMLYRACERAKKARLQGDSDEESDDNHSPDSPTPQPDNPSPPRRRRVPEIRPDPFSTPVKIAITSLRTTSAAFLVSSPPVHSSSTPPHLPPTVISPEKARNTALLTAEPTTALERELQVALRAQQDKNKVQKTQMVAMQSALVLNGAYCDLVRSQLAAQEEKKNKKKKGRLVGDGLPRLLTAREFVRRIEEFEKNATEKAAALEQRKATRLEKADALKGWKVLDEERKERNKEIKEEWKERVKEWEAERDLAREEHRRPGWKKPVLKDLLFPPLPKPGFAVEPGEKMVETDEEEGGKDNGSRDSDSDSDEDSDLPNSADESGNDSDAYRE
ncbi:HTH CENPB-type domain-containing protein [Mycena venus]|uniref:HTH CENPB-type domain-containing protein n=1 Tax=Mycena venus TaxID=2733690 RepID=A0A8H7DEE5_9AGAR|nr:HTH CENPB-type domain-containing protein [Mycena venus]